MRLRVRSGIRALPRAVTVVLPKAPRVALAQSEPLARPVALAVLVVRAVRAALAEWVVQVVRLPSASRARSVRRMVVTPRLRVATAPRTVRPRARELVRQPRWVAISERVTRQVVRPPLRADRAALARVAARVLPAARAVPVRPGLAEPRPAARVVWPMVGRAVRSGRVLVVTPARRPAALAPAVRVPRARVAVVATPTVASRSPRLYP